MKNIYKIIVAIYYFGLLTAGTVGSSLAAPAPQPITTGPVKPVLPPHPLVPPKENTSEFIFLDGKGAAFGNMKDCMRKGSPPCDVVDRKISKEGTKGSN